MISESKSKALITSASSKFFPSLLNMLGSLEKNYPGHPDVYVYDLGLFHMFRKELESIPWVHILEVPHFVPHWRSCYTWKTYILNTPLADLNFYLDAGCQILQPLDSLFEKIERQDYVAVDQGTLLNLRDVTPPDYMDRFGLVQDELNLRVIAAGLFGFKKNSSISVLTKKLYRAGVEGLCVGFSPTELWKNKGVNKTGHIRDCRIFRHDTTLISILFHKYVTKPSIESVDLFSDAMQDNDNQIIWNFRMNYRWLDFIKACFLHSKPYPPYVHLNRIIVTIFLMLKNIRLMLK